MYAKTLKCRTSVSEQAPRSPASWCNLTATLSAMPFCRHPGLRRYSDRVWSIVDIATDVCRPRLITCVAMVRLETVADVHSSPPAPSARHLPRRCSIAFGRRQAPRWFAFSTSDTIQLTHSGCQTVEMASAYRTSLSNAYRTAPATLMKCGSRAFEPTGNLQKVS